MTKKTKEGVPFIGAPEVFEDASAREYERVQDQAGVRPGGTAFQVEHVAGQYGGIQPGRRESVPGPPETSVHTLRDRLFELPFHLQLAFLRTIAPRILENLSPNDREAFFLSLGDDLNRRIGGQGSLPFH